MHRGNSDDQDPPTNDNHTDDATPIDKDHEEHTPVAVVTDGRVSSF
jgi:hypothetical protein